MVQINNPPAEFEQQLFRTFCESTNDFIGAAEKKSMSLVYVNPKGVELFEAENEQALMGKNVWEFIRPCSMQNNRSELLPELEKGGSSEMECEYTSHLGNKFWGRSQFSSFANQGKEFYFIRIEKIDRMKQAEQHLELEQLKFEAFMENASAGVMLINEKGTITAANPLAAELFGYMPGALKNKPMEILLPPNIRYKHKGYEIDFFMEASLKPRKQSKDVTGMRKDGSMFPLEVKLGTYKYGNEVFVMAFLTDISERKESEKAIRNLNLELEQKIRDRTEALASIVVKLEQQIKETEEAEKELEGMLAKEKHLNELKSRFVSIASHEFKTPLSTILSSAYLIQMYTQAEEQVKRNKHIERIVHSVNNLTSILNEFLNVGKLEEGKLVVNPQEIELESHVREMMNECASLLKEEQEIEYVHNGPTYFFTDITLIRHIILNLLTNAIKFSPSDKKVHLSTSIENNHLFVTVRDEGMGIPEEDKQHLFERFFRGSNAMTVQGTGLGLHIVGRYTELLGGEITCESKLGEGTKFMLQIPSL